LVLIQMIEPPQSRIPIVRADRKILQQFQYYIREADKARVQKPTSSQLSFTLNNW
jgi:hypothetical protein